MKKKERIYFVAIFSLALWGLSSLSCAINPVTAGLSGALVGAGATMYLDDDPDIIVDGEQLQISGAESNAFSLLEAAIENLWSIALICLIMWLMPSPQQLLKRWKKKHGQ
tara:strand:+ start:675 stop:1004 length:330 start_codon:yes stop_codon:yes gene_type:complete